MTKEKLIEILQAGNTVVNELSTDKAYIIQVEFGNLPKEQVSHVLKHLADKLREIGLEKFVITPAQNGVGTLTFFEIKDDKVVEVK